jgi:hypothetical protein
MYSKDEIMKCQCGYEYQYEMKDGKIVPCKGEEEFLILEPIISIWGSRGKRKGKTVACPKCGLVYFVEEG